MPGAEAEGSGCDYLTFIGKNMGGRPMTYLEHCQYRKVDGVLIANVDFSDPGVVELVKSGVPVITIDYAFDSTSHRMSDNMEGLICPHFSPDQKRTQENRFYPWREDLFGDKLKGLWGLTAP